MELRDMYSIQEMTDYDIIEQVFGHESVRLKGWGHFSFASLGATDVTSQALERIPSKFKQQLSQQSILHVHGLIPSSLTSDA